MSKKYLLYILILSAACFFISCAVKPKIAPIKKTITIFYTRDLKLKDIDRISTLVKREKEKNPCLFVINGKIFSEEPITTLNRGEAEVSVLNGAGIDAIILTPDFLRFGSQRAQELINKGDFFFLAANLIQTNQPKPFAHEYLIKDLEKTKVSLLGLLLDSTNFYLKLPGIERNDLIHTTKRLVPLLRMRSDLVGLAVATSDTLTLSDADFLIGAINSKSISAPACGKDETLRRLDLFLGGNNSIIDFRNSAVPVNDTITEDSLAKATIQKYAMKTDSILDSKITESKKDLDVKNLTSIINQAILTETKADAIIIQNPFVAKPISKGLVTYRSLYEVLRFKQNLSIVSLSGKEVQALKTKGFDIVLSAKLKNQKLFPNQNYRIVTIPELLTTDSEWQNKEMTLIESSLVTIAANFLRKAGNK